MSEEKGAGKGSGLMSAVRAERPRTVEEAEVVGMVGWQGSGGLGGQPRNALSNSGLTLGPRDALSSCVLGSCDSSWDPRISSEILLTEKSHGFLGEETLQGTSEWTPRPDPWEQLKPESAQPNLSDCQV